MTALHWKLIFVVDPITYCGVVCAVRVGATGVWSTMTKLPEDELADTAVV